MDAHAAHHNDAGAVTDVCARARRVAGAARACRRQDWPARPMTMVIPFSAAGGVDVVGRIMGARMAEILGRPIIIENVGGAGGMVGSSRVAKATPDGYQFVLGSVGTHAQNQTLYKNPLYNTATDFAPVALVAEQPIILAARSTLPADQSARSSSPTRRRTRRKMQYGSPGSGSSSHLACALLTSAIGASKVTHIPYRTGGVVPDLIAGRIDYQCPTGAVAVPLIEGKQAKLIATLTRDRWQRLPDLPTAHEQGLTDFEAYIWFALFLPRGNAAGDRAEAQRRRRRGDEHARGAGAARRDRRDGGRAGAPVAGIPAEIRRERNREMGGADQGGRYRRRIIREGANMPVRVIAVATFLTLLAAPAAAQTLRTSWPNRPVTMVVTYVAGGTTDIIGRIIGTKLSEILKQQVVIENVGGAGGMTGAARVAKATPDGYQFVLGNVGTHAQNQTLYKNPSYNAMTDFAPAGLLVDLPMLMVARTDLPANNLAEFIAYAKVNQAKMQYASAGTGAPTHLACALLNVAMGVNITHVPYRGSALALQDMIAGRIDYHCLNASAAIPHLEGKTAKAITMTTKERSQTFPTIPTAHEQGLKDFVAENWLAFFFPKGTPPAIVQRLNEAAIEAMTTPAVAAQLKKNGADIVAPERRTPEYLQKFVASEIDKWAGPIKAAGLTGN